MDEKASPLSTGLAGFDAIIQKVSPGDNIVLRLDSIDDFLPFVRPFCRYASVSGRKLIYFRFGSHKPLVEPGAGVEIYNLDLDEGFESFTTRVNSVINRAGTGYYYVFDLLSEIAQRWCNDRMLGNFFMQTCPYLFRSQSLSLFALLRDFHSFHATRPIVDNARIVVNIYKHDGRLYVHPTKVAGRYSPTMNTIHLWEDDKFIPIRDSGKVTEVLSSGLWFELDAANERHGFWARMFAEAERIKNDYNGGTCCEKDYGECLGRLVRMTISREPRIISLAQEYFPLSDVINIRKRMIGTGLIGGKSVGMLLARAIVRKRRPDLAAFFEPHDSFFIGTDVFYTFLVKNKIWHIRQQQREGTNVLENAAQGREQILQGQFPEYLLSQFVNMLDYFGQSPIIVRSSSLLEDNYGNAFAGKYKSFFCVNQGTREERLYEFINAVKKIYASSMSEEALVYRMQRCLLNCDEPMALLVQRVSGSVYGNMFYPQCAGVGFSFNPYVWDGRIDPSAGMLRLVFGLGTRAVERVDDDYTRIIALNEPERRPETDAGNIRRYSQHKVDVLDLQKGTLCSRNFEEVVSRSPLLPVDYFIDSPVSQDDPSVVMQADAGGVIGFSKLLKETGFAETTRRMLAEIQQAYGSPVDIEFTVNIDEGGFRINLLQCRPLEIKGAGMIDEPAAVSGEEQIILKACGPVIGQSRIISVDMIIYVVPQVYSQLSIQDRYSIARLIGKITHCSGANRKTIMLIGPGRWGTSTPSLGVPVSYREISTVSVIVEVGVMGNNILPDMSLGTHFLSDFIESQTLYLGLKPRENENFIREDFFLDSDNRLGKLLPDAAKWAQVIRVIEADGKTGRYAKLYANALEQKFACYIDSAADNI